MECAIGAHERLGGGICRFELGADDEWEYSKGLPSDEHLGVLRVYDERSLRSAPGV